MVELKITDSTKAILDQNKDEIARLQRELSILTNTTNDILNVVMFEAHIDPNKVEDLEIDGLTLKFNYEKASEKDIQGNEVREDTEQPGS